MTTRSQISDGEENVRDAIVIVVQSREWIYSPSSSLRLGRAAVLEAPPRRRGPERSGDLHTRSRVPSAPEALQEGRLEDQMPGEDIYRILEIEWAQHRGWEASEDTGNGEQGDKGARAHARRAYPR